MVEAKSICVYCGSKAGLGETYLREAGVFGSAIARRGMGLVYGGGNVGLMGAVAQSALAAGGRVVGVIPRSLEEKELACGGLHELIVTDDMHERKAIMASHGDAFVALPGGYGTLEELFEALAWSQLGFHAKPVGLLNTAGYFDPLIAFLDQAVDRRFLRPQDRSLLQVETEAEPLVRALADRIGA